MATQKCWDIGNKQIKKYAVIKKKQLEEYCATNSIKWQQVDILEGQNFSGINKDRGSPVCNKLHLQFVAQFQNNGH